MHQTGAVPPTVPPTVVRPPALMVQGTSSWAGKSLLTTALCRAYARRGLRVVPFKAQNMSNNARVVAGGEIGSAQYLQALAARVTPSVRHNPVLLKPEGETRSQVVVLGQVDRALTEAPWRGRSARLWPVVAEAYDGLVADDGGPPDLVVIEGAGSPAEVNLAPDDIVNMRVARHAGAAVLLVSDIGRGGAFASLYGTWALLPPEERALVTGFVLNRFLGDVALLDPAPAMLQDLTGVPVVGVLPELRHHLPDEDGARRPRAVPGGLRVRCVRGPAASNLDEWWLLQSVTDFRWATGPDDLADADLVVLPGSKLVARDLEWMRSVGLDRAVREAVDRGVRVVATCGGLQALGGAIDDPHGVERAAHGLGVLCLATTFAATKAVRPVAARFADALPGPWAALAGLAATGYEIRYGGHGDAGPGATAAFAGDPALGLVRDGVLATYVHGLFERPDVVEAVTGRRPPVDLDAAFDELADAAEAHLPLDALLADARRGHP